MKSTRPPSSALRIVAALALSAVAVAAATTARAEVAVAGTRSTTTDWRGSGFVMLLPDPADALNLSFVETGAYEMRLPVASASPLRDITLTYSVYGMLNALTGIASFSGGVVNLYADSVFNFGLVSPGSPVVYGADDGTSIATFRVTGGGGVANGSLTVQADAVAGSVASGYFSSESGVDMATAPGLQLAVTIGDTVDPSPAAGVVAEIVCKAASFPGPGCAGGSYANTPYTFVVTDSAQAVLSASVPEPTRGALALAGIGLVGLVAWRRRPVR